MIINKASYERGFGYGYVYKTKVIDLDEEEKSLASSTIKPRLTFSNIRVAETQVTLTSPSKDWTTKTSATVAAEHYCEELDVDGLPCEGLQIRFGDALACLVDVESGAHHLIKHKEAENAFVDTVRIIGGGDNKSGEPVRIC